MHTKYKKIKPLSEKIIRPIIKADTEKGRINRKLIQNIFFIDIDRPTKMNGFTPYMFEEMAKAFTEYENETMLYVQLFILAEIIFVLVWT